MIINDAELPIEPPASPLWKSQQARDAALIAHVLEMAAKVVDKEYVAQMLAQSKLPPNGKEWTAFDGAMSVCQKMESAIRKLIPPSGYVVVSGDSLRDAYVGLLMHPQDSWRNANQPLYATLRSHVSQYVGVSEEHTQNSCEDVARSAMIAGRE
jgi:hypothetical protein